jgi:aminopeptidase N
MKLQSNPFKNGLMKEKYFLKIYFIIIFFLISALTKAQLGIEQKSFTRADTLRGSITAERAWWDVNWYGIDISPDYLDKSLSGSVTLRFRVLTPGKRMQIDLQQPMQIEKVIWREKSIAFERSGNVYFINFPEQPITGNLETINITYSGKPVVAVRPPWDGGWIFSKDKMGRPWMSVACQGLGASVWYPCKDHQGDEPDSASISITVPDTLMAVANGRLRSAISNKPGTMSYTWAVTNPINNYNIIPYIGKYTQWTEIFNGEKGVLDCSYFVLDYNKEIAQNQFKQANSMLRCFEYWFGPYPFYEDGYKLVESPHLGMEHQSAVAYGNGFMNGYRGRDLSQTGYGLKWDFIIIHESGHEWFGNSITSKDLADMWIHESFTNYSETIYTSCQSGVLAGNGYVQGTRALIENDRPVVGKYGVNDEGSGDMYYKGGNMIHYMRQLFKDDNKFRLAMRAMNENFYHKTVTYDDVVSFWSIQAGMDLMPLFNQYLTTTQIPKLEYKLKGKKLQYRWVNCIPGYNIPVKVIINKSTDHWLEAEPGWKNLIMGIPVTDVIMHPAFYVSAEKIK